MMPFQHLTGEWWLYLMADLCVCLVPVLIAYLLLEWDYYYQRKK